MKRLLYNIFLFLCLTFLLSCSKSEISEIRLSNERDTISLGFSFRSVTQSETEVKSPIVINETTVNNVNIYVFNELGDVITHSYSLGGTSLSGIVIYRNMRYRVYAIVNAGESLPLKTVSEVEALSRSISSISQVADATGGVLMSGKTDLQLLSDGQTVPINLVRCVSKFVLKCDYSQLDPGVSVTVKQVRLKNAPKEIALFGENKATGGKVIDGEVRTGPDLASLSGAGVAFYLFENRQGIVAPSALSNKEKERAMSATAKVNSSYIEMEYDYISPEKRGTIIYRFYLGKTFADCDIKRNHQYTCTVLFKGNGSADENSWSVDNSGLIDRVTGIILDPTSHTMGAGEQVQITATVLPATANNKTITWSTSNPAVATVSATGLVTALADGSCTITATSTDGSGVSAGCAITVSRPDIRFAESSKTMYDGEVAVLTYSKISPPSGVPVVTSSAPGVVEIVESTSAGAKIRAKTVGKATITATLEGISTTCTIDVQLLKIVFNGTAPLTFYQGFDDPVSYTIYPAHAAGLKVNLSSSDNSVLRFMEDNVFRGGTPNQTTDVVATFADFPAKTFRIQAKVKPALTVETTFDLLANATTSKLYNLKHDDIDYTHQIIYDTHPTAKVQWTSSTSGLYISATGLAYLDEKTSLNGIGTDPEKAFTITASVRDLDNKPYKANINVRIYEEVNICLITREYNGFSPEGESGTIIEEEPITNKYPTDVHFSRRLTFTSMGMQSIWEDGIRPYYIDYATVNIIQRRSTRTFPGDIYCYYISYLSEEIKRLNPF